jgi:hypothetical protein
MIRFLRVWGSGWQGRALPVLRSPRKHGAFGPRHGGEVLQPLRRLVTGPMADTGQNNTAAGARLDCRSRGQLCSRKHMHAGLHSRSQGKLAA